MRISARSDGSVIKEKSKEQNTYVEGCIINHHPSHLLSQWSHCRDAHRWVLGLIYQTQGSCYRKVGAMMLFNDAGRQFGLLSGGCLEAELHRQAARVMHTQQSCTRCYDANDEGDITFQLGIGCGGTVHILLHPISAANNYLELHTLEAHLNKGQSVHYQVTIPDKAGHQAHAKVSVQTGDSLAVRPVLKTGQPHTWLLTPIIPPTQLLVVGGGIDARPLVAMAAQLGWRVTLCDPRPANARREHFPGASRITRSKPVALLDDANCKQWDAAVVMAHQLRMDADAVLSLKEASSLKYWALLGPQARKQRVLALAGLSEMDLPLPLAGPAGLALGGELPESIALSILSECHAVLHGADARSLSHQTSPGSDVRQLSMAAR